MTFRGAGAAGSRHRGGTRSRGIQNWASFNFQYASDVESKVASDTLKIVVVQNF